MTDDELPDEPNDSVADEAHSKALRWQIRFSDNSDSPIATGYMPLTSIGEMIWRTPPGNEFAVFADQEEPAKTSRLIASLTHRLRTESGYDFKVSTQLSQLLYTTYREPDPDFTGKRPPVRPVANSRWMILIRIEKNPAYDEWIQRQAAEAEAAANAPPKRMGRPPKPRPEVEPPKRPRGRPRGRPRKNPPPDSGQLDLG